MRVKKKRKILTERHINSNRLSLTGIFLLIIKYLRFRIPGVLNACVRCYQSASKCVTSKRCKLPELEYQDKEEDFRIYKQQNAFYLWYQIAISLQPKKKEATR